MSSFLLHTSMEEEPMHKHVWPLAENRKCSPHTLDKHIAVSAVDMWVQLSVAGSQGGGISVAC